MGLLALDVSRFGIVMSSDSQPVELLAGRNRLVGSGGHLRDNPILVRCGGGFTGLVGYVGRPKIEGIATRSWLERFAKQYADDPLPEFCEALAETLTHCWSRRHLKSGLWIFVSGIDARRDVCFWYVNNIAHMDPNTGTYTRIVPRFQAVNDLDANYIQPQLAPGQTKAQLLQTRMYFFRNGVLRPSALIFDGFNAIMQTIYLERIPGFAPIRSLDDLAFFDRQRMEFTKRLYSPKHGISTAKSAAIAGEVHVLGVTREAAIREYGKLRSQVKTIWPST